MIKTIIKRNGERQSFDPKKANGWGEWASKTLHGRVDWGSAVLYAANRLPEETTSLDFQNALIDYCLNQGTDEYSRMAGRLYTALVSKTIYGKKKRPSVKDLHKLMVVDGLMIDLGYSDDEYAKVEGIIDHRRDLKMRHYQVHQIRQKYALRNKVTGKEYETAQFVYMRMAMALAADEPAEQKMTLVEKWYTFFSLYKINPPTPNFVNLGTSLKSYVSCCLYESGDSWKSLAAGDHIAYAMTCMSAGIGANIRTRSIGDPVRNGLFPHQGKLPYYKALQAMVGANLQNGRGGAATVYYTAFDPEAEVIMALRNPITPAVRRIPGLDYSFGFNRVFARAVARDELFAPISLYKNPELYDLLYTDSDKFTEAYAEHLKSVGPEDLVSARDLLVNASIQAVETGRHYFHNIDEMNRHTPFKDPIRLSNLCAEVALPTKPFESVVQLYEDWTPDHGEIALCNLGGIIVSNIASDDEYAEAAYLTLKMIDKTIMMSDYPFKSLKTTAHSRMNAGVGVLGLAHLMAKRGLKYSSQEGRNFIHTAFESHAWHLINASLKISQERGVAPWMNKTKWPEGWLPIDSYNKNVDQLVTVSLTRDWESLRAKIIENGGIGHSALINHMPGESSTIAAGTTNGVYPIRDKSINKSNDTSVVRWVAPESSDLDYEIVWDIDTNDMIAAYAIMQKFTDQAISADFYLKLQGGAKVTDGELVETFVNFVKYGMKTRYYTNSLTAKGVDLNTELASDDDGGIIEDVDCESCKL